MYAWDGKLPLVARHSGMIRLSEFRESLRWRPFGPGLGLSGSGIVGGTSTENFLPARRLPLTALLLFLFRSILLHAFGTRLPRLSRSSDRFGFRRIFSDGSRAAARYPVKLIGPIPLAKERVFGRIGFRRLRPGKASPTTFSCFSSPPNS